MVENPKPGDVVWVMGWRPVMDIPRVPFEPVTVIARGPGSGHVVKFQDAGTAYRRKLYTEEEALALLLLRAAGQEVE